ncbi:MAG: aminopeptidase P family protein [Mesorhizobium sp.]
MFQSFDVKSDPSQGKARVAALRRWMADHGLDGVIVPRSDEHQGEYVAERAERLQWLTGFAGSAGAAIVLANSAYIFVDGRYTLQVRQQADMDVFDVESLVDNPPAKWLGDNAARGARIGFDPWLHTTGEAKALRDGLARREAELVPLDQNPIDAIWDDQPGPPLEPVTIQEQQYAGELAREKLARLASAIAASGASHAILTDPSSLAWTFNIRGSDVPHTPLALGFAILAADGPHQIFIDKRKLPIEPRAYLTQLADILPPSSFETEVARIAKAGAHVALDPTLAAEKLRMIVEDNGGKVIAAPDPARLPRATKNAAELAGSRAAHRRDGAAMTGFLKWIDEQPPGSVDEIEAATMLEAIRAETGQSVQMPLRDISFDTISGAGPHGAIIHYRVTTPTNRKLGDGELYLIDSGAQYSDGTTDITRTLPIGAASEETRRRYTLVLKGMIQISMLRFPPGTRGCDIDAFARAALWKEGLDYAHGTGHGVGSFLAVHEGPQRIAKSGTEKLLAGMILSNEPGYYKEGEYGIRLENLIVVTPASLIDGGELPMHGFETLTLAPFDRSMIEVDRLTVEERDWLDAYHARVYDEVSPLIDDAARGWLKQATAPL